MQETAMNIVRYTFIQEKRQFWYRHVKVFGIDEFFGKIIKKLKIKIITIQGGR